MACNTYVFSPFNIAPMFRLHADGLTSGEISISVLYPREIQAQKYITGF